MHSWQNKGTKAVTCLGVLSLPAPFTLRPGPQLQATSPSTSIADDLDVGRGEEGVEASGHGRKAFLE